MIWLPIRCPVLNPMEHLWRAAKHSVCANRQDVSIDLAVLRVLRYLQHVTPREALRKAGVSFPHFWLRAALSNHYRRPT